MIHKVDCPCCHYRLLDADEQAYRATKVCENRPGSRKDYQIKCPKCKKLINIIKEAAS